MDKWRITPVGLCSMVYCRSSGTIDGLHTIPVSVINATFSNYLKRDSSMAPDVSDQRCLRFHP